MSWREMFVQLYLKAFYLIENINQTTEGMFQENSDHADNLEV